MPTDRPDQGERTKLPPHSAMAERGVIGGALRWPAALDDVTPLLAADSFYDYRHQCVFRAMADLRAAGKPVDTVTVFEELRRRGQTADVPAAYLAELWDEVPTGANVAYHAGIVRDRHLARSLIHFAGELARDAQDGAQPAEDLLGAAELALSALRLSGRESRLLAMPEVLDRATTRIDARGRSADPGVTTGLGGLDAMIGGFRGGELICLAARPSVGKSALAQAIATNAARAGRRVLFASLEMAAAEVGQRLLVAESGVPNYLVRHGRVGDREAADLVAASERLRPLPVLFDEDPGLSVARLAAKARAARRGGGLDLVVVDYLQLLKPENPRSPRHEQVGSMSRSLKLLAKELDAPVVALSQLTRAVDSEGRAPRLSDIRESGSVEQDCDVVILMHRPGEGRSDPELIELIVAKQRNGETGVVPLSYRGSRFRFEQPAPDA